MIVHFGRLWFCGVTCPTLFYQNLEFFREDLRKSDVEYENGPQMESRKVSLADLCSD